MFTLLFSEDNWFSSNIYATITATSQDKQPFQLVMVSRVLKRFDRIPLEIVDYVSAGSISQSECFSLVVIYDNGF